MIIAAAYNKKEKTYGTPVVSLGKERIKIDTAKAINGETPLAKDIAKNLECRLLGEFDSEQGISKSLKNPQKLFNFTDLLEEK